MAYQTPTLLLIGAAKGIVLGSVDVGNRGDFATNCIDESTSRSNKC